MSRHEPTPSATDESGSLDGWERALLDRQLEALGRLADMGMAMAAAIERRVTAAEPGADAVLDGADLSRAAMDFARVSRAVRMTFALQSRLIADFKGASEARPARSANSNEWFSDFDGRPDIVDNDVVRKRQLKGIVKQLGEAASLDGEAVERLVREADERLEDDRFYRGLTERPMGEMVALVCKDLGIEPDWELLSDIYWAKEEIDRPRPGSPYAGWKARQAAGTAPALVPSG
jgi:hypothetical protein